MRRPEFERQLTEYGPGPEGFWAGVLRQGALMMASAGLVGALLESRGASLGRRASLVQKRARNGLEWDLEEAWNTTRFLLWALSIRRGRRPLFGGTPLKWGRRTFFGESSSLPGSHAGLAEAMIRLRRRLMTARPASADRAHLVLDTLAPLERGLEHDLPLRERLDYRERACRASQGKAPGSASAGAGDLPESALDTFDCTRWAALVGAGCRVEISGEGLAAGDSLTDVGEGSFRILEGSGQEVSQVICPGLTAFDPEGNLLASAPALVAAR